MGSKWVPVRGELALIQFSIRLSSIAPYDNKEPDPVTTVEEGMLSIHHVWEEI